MAQWLTNTSARELEFEALREVLGGYVASEPGHATLKRLAPSCDLDWIVHQQQLTEEIRAFRRAGGNFDFAGTPAVGALLDKSRIEGAVLETLEIREILRLVERASEWRQIALDPPQAIAGDWSAVRELSSSIADFRDFLKSFEHTIAADGSLDDRASAELARIRREVERQKRSIQNSLEEHLRRLSQGGAVQEEVVTIRGERFVIPVKAEHKRRVAGVVHGASSSGQTVFIEPLETIEENNELVRLLEDEQAEITRILDHLTRRIGDRADDIRHSAEILAQLELQFAKARFAEEYNCVRPRFTRPGEEPKALILLQARHPLLEQQRRNRPRVTAADDQAVVPISIELEGERLELIITGPNTGGKTVALKTVGLLALMAQSGLPVPAGRMETVAFDAVLADIGDAQSIEQNLSTFSAHIAHLEFIFRTATAQSLVLIDELGSATDPEEGAALAAAIAERLAGMGCITIISTHHSSLKIFAQNSPRALNAAVGFDPLTLKPTYELKLGVPGASAGIQIAERLGLTPAIIQAARARLSGQARELSEFLDRLHRELGELEAERIRLQKKQEEFERAEARLATEGRREQQRKAKELETKLASLLRDFEYRAGETLKEITDRAQAQKVQKDAERRIARLHREFREQFDSTVVAHMTGADQGDPGARPGMVEDVHEGDWVKLKSVGRTAKVTRRLDRNQYEVAMGAMKMKVPAEDVAEIVTRASETPLEAARARGVSVALARGMDEVGSEINVIGYTVEDATREVDKFIDRAFLAGLPRVRIVHGSGMGVLRRALRQLLEQHPHVQAVNQPPQNEGGAGATVAELKQ